MQDFSGRLWPRLRLLLALILALTFAPSPLLAAAPPNTADYIDLTQHPVGYLAFIIFFLAYAFVAIEESIQLRKSKPVMLAAGLIWALLGVVYMMNGKTAVLEAAAKHVILDYGELILFSS